MGYLTPDLIPKDPKIPFYLFVYFVRLSLGEGPGEGPPRLGRPGVRSHGLLPVLAGVGERGGSRREVPGVLGEAAAKRGVFFASEEDLTPLRRDPLSLVPLAVIVARLLRNPRRAELISSATVSDYALTPEAIRTIPASR